MSEAINDAQLGHLAWEPSFGWWSGVLKLADEKQAELHISTVADDDQTITEEARRAFGRVVSSDRALRRKP